VYACSWQQPVSLGNGHSSYLAAESTSTITRQGVSDTVQAWGERSTGEDGVSVPTYSGPQERGYEMCALQNLAVKNPDPKDQALDCPGGF